jgi:hypothetical protein
VGVKTGGASKLSRLRAFDVGLAKTSRSAPVVPGLMTNESTLPRATRAMSEKTTLVPSVLRLDSDVRPVQSYVGTWSNGWCPPGWKLDVVGQASRVTPVGTRFPADAVDGPDDSTSVRDAGVMPAGITKRSADKASVDRTPPTGTATGSAFAGTVTPAT